MVREIKFRGKRLDMEEWAAREREQIKVGTCGQYTGLQDSNSKEIYEGDILIEPSVATIPLEVRYNEKQCAFCLIEHTHTEGPLLGTCPLGDMLRQYPSMKVVGNIHDNPDILTKWQTK